MPNVTFILLDGATVTLAGEAGQSVMQVATRAGIRGIEALCGGSLSCATCHVYVEPDYLDRLPEMSVEEEDTLFGAIAERRPNSRLSCQLELGEALDGLVVRMPDRQT